MSQRKSALTEGQTAGDRKRRPPLIKSKWVAGGLCAAAIGLAAAAIGIIACLWPSSPAPPEKSPPSQLVSQPEQPKTPAVKEPAPQQTTVSAPEEPPAAVPEPQEGQPPADQQPAPAPQGAYSQEALDEKLSEVIASIITDGMTKREQAYAVFRYVHKHVRYVGTSIKSSWQEGAFEGLNTGRGDCYTYYALSRALLTALDIDNLEVQRTGGKDSHYWNLVNCGDGWYHFDAGPHSVPMPNGGSFFMFTDAAAAAYTAAAGRNYYDFDGSLYPDRAEDPGAPTADEQPSADEQTPPDEQLPQDGQTPPDEQLPQDGQTPPDGQIPQDGQTPPDEQIPPEEQIPQNGQIPPEEQIPQDGQTPPDEQIPQDEQTPPDGQPPESEQIQPVN